MLATVIAALVILIGSALFVVKTIWKLHLSSVSATNHDNSENSMKFERGQLSSQCIRKMTEKYESLCRILKELQTLRNEGRQRLDVVVKSVEKKAIKIMNIHPKVWIDCDKSIDDVIETLTKYSNELSIALMENENINTEHLLKNTLAAGHALEGVLLKQSLSDLMANRKRMVECPENCLIEMRNETPNEEILSFDSFEDEQFYESCMQFLGYTVDCSALQITHGGTTYRTDGTSLMQSDQTTDYESTIKKTIFPTASVIFKMEELKLTNDALQDILVIEQKIVEHGVHSLHVLALCIQFFKDFGSHISCGPIVFGGIHSIKSSSSSIGTRKLQRSLLQQHHFVSALCIQPVIKFSASDVNSEISSHIKMSLESCIIGGISTGDPTEWCAGIAANSNTWSIIDRGENYVPVWDIISFAYKNELKSNAETLAETLMYSFEIFTGNPNVERNIEFLDRLGLLGSYPGGISMRQAVSIRKSTLDKEVCDDPKKLPVLLLQKIMSQDSRSRLDLLATSLEDEFITDDIDMHSTISGSTNICQEIHPMDSFLSLFLCSDAFLRQDMLVRIASCQLSVPLITLDPFSKKTVLHIWAAHPIIKIWKRRSIKKILSEKGAEDKATELDKEGTSVSEKEVIDELEYPIIQYPTNIILFLRLGENLSFSKSKILNSVLSDTKYSHFFHRDCNGGTFQRILSKGLVDMCWYLPAGKTGDVFSDAITFLNLHGCAHDHVQQVDLLQEMASLSFIFLGKSMLKPFEVKLILKFSKSILLLTDEAPGNIGEVKCEKVQIVNLVHKNEDRIKTIIRHCIKRFSEESQNLEKRSIESFVNDARMLKLTVDKDDQDFNSGQNLANQLLQLVSSDGKNAKKEILPLQGKQLWHKWAKKDKEQHRQVSRGESTAEEYVIEMEKEKKAIRLEQKEHVDNLSPFIIQFIASLQDQNKSVVFYFLKCLNTGLNNLSRSSISCLQSKYQVARKKLAIIQGENDSRLEKMPEEQEVQKELDQLHQELIDTSFGLEHLLREIGQIYETAYEFNEVDQFCHLPATAAWLLANGYPLEVMDGDAAHLPKQWVQAVLKEAVKQLNNPRIFVLSVLGLQSTGKSTMLNAVFGLQFTVSSGRCTRGAYMQLLPISEELKASEVKCDYILVVDTEGLRAPELDSLQTQKHDNELATFVIGLADATLINIYGEVPGEMDDILQTAVHAFIRMKKVRLKPSCQFVHQNAGASSKTDMGRDKFTQKLNMMTKEAAKEEGCPGEFERFTNVIRFDDQKDVHHFTSLWMGDPPMAPVNHGYSQNAQLLKLAIINMIEETTCTSLDSFQLKLGDLWNALLHERFVFSFKNTLEITAYNSLETEYNRCMLKFKEQILIWQETTANEIEGAPLEKLEMIEDQKLNILNSELQKLIDTLREKYEKELKVYFEESKQADIIAQWQGTFLGRLGRLAEGLHAETKRHCRQLVTNKKLNSDIRNEKEKYKDVIIEGVKEIVEKIKKERDDLENNIRQGEVTQQQFINILKQDLFEKSKLHRYVELEIISIEKMKKFSKLGQLNVTKLQEVFYQILTKEESLMILHQGRLTETQVKEEFEKHWKKLISKIPPYAPKETHAVLTDVYNELTAFVGAGKASKVAEAWEAIKSSNLKLSIVAEQHIKRKRDFKVMRAWDKTKQILNWETVTEMHVSQAQQINDVVLQNVVTYCKECRRKHSYTPGLTTSLLQILQTASTNSIAPSQEFEFTSTYLIYVYVVACKYAVKEFQDMVEAFNRKNNPVVWLEEEMKDQLFTLFKNQYNQIAHEEAVANTLCGPLVRVVIKQLKKSLGRVISVGISKEQECFQNKGALKVAVMTDLAEDLQRTDDFSAFATFLVDVKQSMNDWVSFYVKKYCDAEDNIGESNFHHLASNEVDNIIESISKVIKSVTNSFHPAESAETKIWILRFCENNDLIKRLGDTTALDVSALHENEGATQKIELASFSSEVQKALAKAKINIKKQLPADMNSWDTSPEKFLDEIGITGCSNQCPFCGEQCDRGPHEETENIKHKAELHRPSCVAGWRNSWTNIMVTDTCTSLVDSDRSFINSKTNNERHPYKEYQKIYPFWSIPADKSMKSSLYWKWFVANFHEHLAKHYGAKSPSIPDDWQKLEWTEVKKDLRDHYNL